jgi:hypothetical protein
MGYVLAAHDLLFGETAIGRAPRELSQFGMLEPEEGNCSKCRAGKMGVAKFYS